MSVSRTRSDSSDPIGCGARAIASTCFWARPAAKRTAGASAGSGAGGCWAWIANQATATAAITANQAGQRRSTTSSPFSCRVNKQAES